jgi:hypothetical protein
MSISLHRGEPGHRLPEDRRGALIRSRVFSAWSNCRTTELPVPDIPATPAARPGVVRVIGAGRAACEPPRGTATGAGSPRLPADTVSSGDTRPRSGSALGRTGGSGLEGAARPSSGKSDSAAPEAGDRGRARPMNASEAPPACSPPPRSAPPHRPGGPPVVPRRRRLAPGARRPRRRTERSRGSRCDCSR